MKVQNRSLIFIASILLLSYTYVSHASPAMFSGTVLDKDSGAPVDGASVRIIELNMGTFTSENGFFSIAPVPDGEYTVQVTITGYAPVTRKVHISGTSNFQFMLTPSPIFMDEIVSTARGIQTKLNNIPGSVEVVSDADFQEINPLSIPEALSRRPGLAVNSEMPWSSRVVIRGLTKDKIVMLVDGCRVMTTTEIPAQFGTIANGDIERIELLKGPISVLYGSGSTGGVVNVITRQGQFAPQTKVSFSINPSYESGANGISIYERVSLSAQRLYLTLSQANRTYTDYRAADNLRIPNSQFEDHQTQVNLGIKLFSQHTIEGRYQYFSALDVGIPGGTTFPPHALAQYPTTSRSLTDIVWSWQPGGTWFQESKINVYYQPIERNVNIHPHTPPTIIPHPTEELKSIKLTPMAIYPEADHHVYGARWQNNITLGHHTIVAGLEGWEKRMVSDRIKKIEQEIIMTDTGIPVGEPKTIIIKDTPVPKSRQRPIGAFAEDTFSFGERSTLTLGVRVDQIHTENERAYLTYQPPSDSLIWDAYEDDDISWSLIAGTVIPVSEDVNANLSLARSFRSPTIEERYLYADLGGVLTVGNPAIDAEKGTFIECGVTTTLRSVKFNAQVFLNSLTDMVIKKPGGELKGRRTDFQYANAGKARLWGFETRADWLAVPRVLLSADVAYIRGTDEKEDCDLPAMPPLKAHVSARWEVKYGFWIEPLITLVNKQDRIAPGERKTPGYGIMDIVFGKTVFRTGNISHNLVIGIKNMNDKLYRDHLTESRGYEMYGMGRSFYTSWRIQTE